MQSINTNSQSSYTPSIASNVFECEDLQNVLCSYLSEWQKTCLLSTNKIMEPARWTQGFSFGKDKVKVAAFKELIYSYSALELAKKEYFDKAYIDFSILCNNSIIKERIASDGLNRRPMVDSHTKWDSITSNLFKEITLTQFYILIIDSKTLKNCELTQICKSDNFKETSVARLKLQALAQIPWFGAYAWEAEQVLRNVENFESTKKNLENTTSQISLEYPMVKQDKNRGNVISDKVLVDMINRYEIKIALSA